MAFVSAFLYKLDIKRVIRVATVREKYLENEIFSSQGKVREFYGWPGKFRKDLESHGKVTGNLKINGYGWQSSENLFILSKRGKGALSHEIV